MKKRFFKYGHVLGLVAICAAMAGSLYSATLKVHVFACHPLEANGFVEVSHVCGGHTHTHVHAEPAATTVHMDDIHCECTLPHGSHPLDWSAWTTRASDRDATFDAAPLAHVLPAEISRPRVSLAQMLAHRWTPPRGPATPALRSVRLQV